MNRVVLVAGSLAAGLLVLTGCSSKDDSASGKTSSAEGKTTTSTAATTSAPSGSTSVPSSSSSVSATPNASKETFCSDVNRAVAIIELPGTDLTADQNNDLLKALWSASDAAPSDVPAEFTEVITALIAVGQGPDSESIDKNGEKLAANAERYCGAPLP